METLHVLLVVTGFLALFWLWSLIFFLPVAGSIWFFGRKRVKWGILDFAAAFAPYAVWAILMMIDDSGKSMSNMVEGCITQWAAAIAPVVRVILGKRLNEKAVAAVMLGLPCLLGIALWMFVPGLPE